MLALVICATAILFGFQNCGKSMQSASTGTSGAANFGGITAPPPSPTRLNAEVLSSTEVAISWVDPSSGTDAAADFYVERATVTGGTVGSYSVVGSLMAGTLMFDDTTVTANTTYNYFVISANAQGASNPTAVVTITTTP